MANKQIDLGISPAVSADVPISADVPVKAPAKVSYPTLYLGDVPELGDLPEGVFTFTATGRVVSYTETNREGKKKCSCEIEVHSIEPKSKVKSKGLAEALDDIEEGKGAEDDDEDN